MPRHADARRIERNGAAEMAALFAGGPVSFSFFALCEIRARVSVQVGIILIFLFY
jgi:hypothetical protein